MAILEVNHIEKHFGKTKVLKDVSFPRWKREAQLRLSVPRDQERQHCLRCLNFLEKPNKGTVLLYMDEILFDASDNVKATDKDADLRKEAPAFWNGFSVL